MNAMMVPSEEQELNTTSNGETLVVTSCFSPPFGASALATASSSSNSSKKAKPKVPQRGLGVAQLERLRLEELQRRNDRFPSPPFEFGAVQLKTNSSVTQTDVKPLGPGSSLHFSSPVAMGTDMFIAGPENLVAGALKHVGLPPFRREGPNLGGTHRLQPPIQFVNFSSNGVNSTRPNESMSTPLEPPSNQIYAGSRYDLLTCWRGREHDRESEREHMGVEKRKRSWPFQVDCPTATPTPYPCKVPSLCSAPHFKVEDSFLNTDVLTCALRSASPNPDPRSYGPYNTKTTRDSGVQLDTTIGAALSLAPSAPITINSMGIERPFYRFLPMRADGHRATSPEQKGESVDGLDLSLKL